VPHSVVVIDDVANQPHLTAAELVQLQRIIEAGLLARDARLSGAGFADATEQELRLLEDQGALARQRFIQANLGLVGMVSRQFAARCQLPDVELFQEGCLGLPACQLPTGRSPCPSLSANSSIMLRSYSSIVSILSLWMDARNALTAPGQGVRRGHVNGVGVVQSHGVPFLPESRTPWVACGVKFVVPSDTVLRPSVWRHLGRCRRLWRWISVTPLCSSVPRLIAAEPTHRSRSRRQPGRTPARWIWWVKNGRHGGVEYAAQTVGNAGSKLLIFDRLPALTAGAVSHTLLRAPAPPAGRATVTRPTQQAGLRSSLGGAPSTAST
jgi:hypothetical protein